MSGQPNREVALFSAALELDAGQRAAYLDEACADDPALRERLAELLRVHQDAITFLESKAPGAQQLPTGGEITGARQRLSRLPVEKAGDHIGRYKLLQQIGEGGCGVVYMAEQEEAVRRRVALKVIKLGMDTKQVIARFEAERQALALMDHPNIAKVLDAGATEAGRPYFVMELVRGIKITDYCDEHSLATEERLKLFIQVCQAIQHAHQKGIIHRDIKPSNILVTVSEPGAPGCPKVIDFGIAKATTGQHLTNKTVFTAFEQFIGTPAYMSPEQAMMTALDIDTRTDIYSLGVLLYELLTGKTPLDQKELLAAGLDEMRRTIREKEPLPPSTRLRTMLEEELTTTAKHRHTDPPRLVHAVRGDLDWIVMKCLEKDRARRYETANGLAMDIHRHLSCEPVVARPPSRLYEFQKTVRRHKFGFAAAAALITVLAIGVVVSTSEAFRATRAERQQSRLLMQAEAEQKKAETEAGKSRQVAGLLTRMLEGAGPSVALGRDTTLLREILDKTAAGLRQDLTNQPEVEIELRFTLGGIYRELGLYRSMEKMYREILQLARTRLGDENIAVARALNGLGEALAELGHPDEGVKLTREGTTMRIKLAGAQDPGSARSRASLAYVISTQGQLAEAETMLREALALQRKLLGPERSDVDASLEELACVLFRQGRFSEAEQAQLEVLEMRKKRWGNEHPAVATALSILANVFLEEGRLAEAEELQRQVLAMQRKFLGNDHPTVASTLGNLGIALEFRGKFAESETMHRQALELKKQLFGHDHPSVADSLGNLADLFLEQGRAAEAERLHREELAIYRGLGNEHASVAGALHNLANALLMQDRLAEAETMLRETLAMNRKLFGNEHPDVAGSLNDLAMVFEEQGRLPEAEAMYRDALAMHRKLLSPRHPHLANSLCNLANVLYYQGKFSEAEKLQRESLAMRREMYGEEHSAVAASLGNLGNVLAGQGKLAEAETMMRAALAVERKLLGNDHPEVATSLNNLAQVLDQEDRLPEAESAQREALAIRRKALGEQHSDVAASFHALYRLLLDQEKLAEAETLLRDQLAGLGWTAAGAASPETPTLGLALHHLASVLQERNAMAEARSLALEAATMYQRHPDWPEHEREHAFRVLGAVLTALRDLPALEAFHRYTLEQNKLLAGTHPRVAASLHDLAGVLKLEGKFPEADALGCQAAERGNVPAMNELAWRLATSPNEKTRDGLVAIAFAEKAVAATNRKEWSVVDTLAAAYAEARQFTNAVRVEREAIGLLESDEDKKPCADRLKLYESGSPYRDPELAAEPAPSAALEAFTRRAGGVLRAQHGRFAEAAADFARVIELHPEDHEVWHWQAVTLVQRGQLDAYREFRHQSVEFFQKTNDPNTAERISKDFLMLPCSGPDLETAARLADTAANAPTNHPDITWFQFTKGLGEYRQGRFTSAVEWMQKVLATSPHDPNRDAEASMVLAMSQYQQKQTEEAYATLAKGIRIADKKSPTLESGNLGDGWVDWIIARALMAEARALIPLPSATTVLSR